MAKGRVHNITRGYRLGQTEIPARDGHPARTMYRLMVPPDIGVALKEAGYTNFTVELNEEGLLYRPVPLDGGLPSWLKKGRADA